MDRRAFLISSAAAILAAPLAAGTQQAAKVWRVGFLSSLAAVPEVEDFRQELRALGYVEARNIFVEYRWAEGDYTRLPNLAKELVGLNPAVIVCAGPPAALAVKAATQTVPVVFIAGNPVGAGIVSSLARPGGNLTGFDSFAQELDAKRLALLKEVLPGAARVALLLNPETPLAGLQRNPAAAAAKALGLRPRFLEARRPDDIDTAFAVMARDRPDGVVVLGDPMLSSERGRIAALAARIRVPVIHYVRDFVEAGGLMSYGPSFSELFRRVATYVDRILKGAKPADLPVEQPTKFDLIINARTAKALGLTIPQSLLQRADEVIQ